MPTSKPRSLVFIAFIARRQNHIHEFTTLTKMIDGASAHRKQHRINAQAAKKGPNPCMNLCVCQSPSESLRLRNKTVHIPSHNSLRHAEPSKCKFPKLSCLSALEAWKGRLSLEGGVLVFTARRCCTLASTARKARPGTPRK